MLAAALLIAESTDEESGAGLPPFTALLAEPCAASALLSHAERPEAAATLEGPKMGTDKVLERSGVTCEDANVRTLYGADLLEVPTRLGGIRSDWPSDSFLMLDTQPDAEAKLGSLNNGVRVELPGMSLKTELSLMDTT
jgi:hypothetical protein